jgi:hypothetical protein
VSCLLHSMTSKLHDHYFLDALERCLLSFVLSCLVLSCLVLSITITFSTSATATSSCSQHLVHLSPPHSPLPSLLTSSSPLYHGPTELGVVLPSLQEVMASESNSTFSACMPKSKPAPASAPTASGFKDSVGTVTDMEGGLFGRGN